MGFDYRRDSSGIVVVTMDMDGKSANTMIPAYHDLMGATVARLEAEEGLKGVIFASAKKTFFAGGDLKSLMVAEAGDDAYKAWLNEDKGFLRRLEKLPVPVVAAINGAALGGGFEICLACNHRIVVNDPAAVVGLPEVTLGLLPGTGGVARLPRLLGPKQALDLLLTGRFVQTQEALSLGLVEEIVPSREDLVPAAMAWILGDTATAQQPWDAEERALSPEDLAGRQQFIEMTRAAVLDRTRGKLPAPMRILDIVEAGLELDLDRTLLLETDLFASLLDLRETCASIWLNFFAANAIRSGRMRPNGDRVKIGSLAVTGTGGNADAIAKAAARKADVVRVAPGNNLPDADLTLAFGGIAGNAPSGVVAFEGGAPQADGLDPARVVGFEIPECTARSKIVEIVAGAGTSNETLRLVYDFFQGIGRTPIVIRDVPGRFVGRLTAACLTEAKVLLAEGLDPAALDKLIRDAGFQIQPSALLQPAPAAQADKNPAEDAADRLLFIQSLEALRCLDEGVIGSEEEADLASVLGAGFPVHTGGAVRFAKGMGAGAFAARTAALADRYGDRFTMEPRLLDRLRPAVDQAA